MTTNAQVNLLSMAIHKTYDIGSRDTYGAYLTPAEANALIKAGARFELEDLESIVYCIAVGKVFCRHWYFKPNEVLKTRIQANLKEYRNVR